MKTNVLVGVVNVRRSAVLGVLGWCLWAAPAAANSLDDLLRASLATHPALVASEARVAASAANVGLSRAPWWPQVGLNGQTARTTSVSQAQNTVQPFNLSQGGINVRQQLYDFDRTRFEVDVAIANQDLATFQARQQAVDIAFQIRRAYILVLQQEALLERARARLNAATTLTRQAQAFYAAGKRPKLDVLRAEAARARSLAEQVDAQQALSIARADLRWSCGGKTLPAQTLSWPITAPWLLKLVKTGNPNWMPRHPSYRLFQGRLVLQKAREASASRSAWPEISADINYGLRTRDDEISQNWFTGLSVNAPIFTGFAETRRTEAAKWDYQAAIAAMEAELARLQNEAQRAIATYQGAEARLPAVHVALASAEEGLRMAQARYQAGVGSLVELNDAEIFLNAARQEVVRAQAARYLALADCLRAWGLTGINQPNEEAS